MSRQVAARSPRYSFPSCASEQMTVCAATRLRATVVTLTSVPRTWTAHSQASQQTSRYKRCPGVASEQARVWRPPASACRQESLGRPCPRVIDGATSPAGPLGTALPSTSRTFCDQRLPRTPSPARPSHLIPPACSVPLPPPLRLHAPARVTPANIGGPIHGSFHVQ
ncbi:hypothetical protein K491DRAFT_78956 [Lophiostoma macrostomum CBS 122681]|uniref:Uncharacterized protein n=1 Tax=Lophiostoma macrostomum CBS 122681 TaxID=1314788 RepID=A0A6A6TLX6_9PLEO|nr:hypothetical protein K491DRAFT_78956 [Lophiostoma macrostomum CBS 122681]